MSCEEVEQTANSYPVLINCLEWEKPKQVVPYLILNQKQEIEREPIENGKVHDVVKCVIVFRSLSSRLNKNGY